MKTQAISNQTFNGKLIFVKKVNNSLKYTAKVEQFFPKDAMSEVNKAKKMVKNEPCDVFISRNEQKPEFYELYANTSHQNIVDGKGGKPTYIHKSLVSTLFDTAVDCAVDNFKNIK